MKESISFDRAAEIYDATRSHPAGVTLEAARALAERLPAGARVLEPGVGTGRICLPLRECGLHMTGLDISPKMMSRLREKLDGSPGPALVEASAMEMPFAAHSFDAAVGVHLLHLVPDWQRVLAEMQRVIRPAGSIALGYDWHPDDCPSSRLRDAWDEILREFRPTEHPTWLPYEDVAAVLVQNGAAHEEFTGAVWTARFTLAGEIERLESRTWSATWAVPEEMLLPACSRLREWAHAEYGDLEQPIETERRFIWHLFRWGQD
jgi:SAM-dependent methyltransferase